VIWTGLPLSGKPGKIRENDSWEKVATLMDVFRDAKFKLSRC